jgi:class 3 adenylate cyclase/predicted alpha/beta hydrolase
MEIPPVRYARSGDVSVAYQVTGESNPIDMVFAPGTVSHLALAWDRPPMRLQIERLSRFCRLIRFDKRGTGMSDRMAKVATLEERTDDIRAVMDAAGSQRAVVLGQSEGGSMACLFAATHPERTRSLIVWGCQARWLSAADYPWGMAPEDHEEALRDLRDNWPSRKYIMTWGAGLGLDTDPAVVDEVLRFFQAAASPSAIYEYERINGACDIRDVLPAIRVPTLVMVRDGDPLAPLEAVRHMASRIPNARMVSFPGRTHSMVTVNIDPEPVFAEIEEFVTGSRSAATGNRLLTTILFIDLVGSTQRAAEIGDSAWRSLLDEHYHAANAELARFGGRLVDIAGDGVLAVFDGPTRALRCAAAILKADRPLGLRARAGVHTGEVEIVDGGIRGLNVHIASRIAGLAEADEILASSTVRDLTAGSGLAFEERGTHELHGVPGPRVVLRALT